MDSDTSTKARSFWSTLPGILTALAALITAVTTLLVAFCFHPDKGITTPSLTPPTIQVFDIQNNGEIFGFDKLKLDAVLGRTTWTGEGFWVSRTPDGVRRRVKVWRTSGGPGITDAHGRYDDRHRAGDWHKGNDIYFFKDPK